MNDALIEASKIALKNQIDDFFDGPETKGTKIFWEFCKTGKWPDDAAEQVRAAGERSLKRWKAGNRKLDEILARDGNGDTTE